MRGVQEKDASLERFNAGICVIMIEYMLRSTLHYDKTCSETEVSEQVYLGVLSVYLSSSFTTS